MSAICSAHAIQRFLRDTLIAFVILFLALFIWLLVGIEINRLKVGDYHIGRLYIKLDKKLTLEADNITLPQSKAKLSFDNVDKVFDQVNHILSYFESIDLKNITFKNNQFDIMFMDNIWYVTSNEYEIAGYVHRIGNTLEADVSMLYVKKDNIHIKGKLIYELDTSRFKTEGDFKAYSIKGKFSAHKIGDQIDFRLSSETFSDFRPLIDAFDMGEDVESWVLDKVESQAYKILFLSGKASVEEGKFKLNFDALKGDILFSKVKIHFKEKLSPILASSFMLSFKDGGVYFDLKKPTFEGLSLEGSEISVLNVLNEKTNLKLKIRTDTPFDTRLQNFLKAYDVLLPIGEKSATVNVLFMADIGLKNDYQDFFAAVNFTQGDIWLQKIRLPIQKGNLQYRNGIITLNDIVLKDVSFEGNVSGTIDLDKKNAALVFDAKHIRLGSKKETFFALKNERIPLKINYKNKTNISIPTFALTLSTNTKNTTIDISDFKKIQPYLNEFALLQEGGNIRVVTKDFKHYTFKGLLKRSACFLYEKEALCKTKIRFEGKANAKDVDLYAFNKRFHYNKSRSRLRLDRLNIDLDKFLETEKHALKKSKIKQTVKSKNAIALTILGTHSHLRYFDYRLMLDSYDVEVKNNGDISAMGSASGDIIKFAMKKDILSMQAFRIKDEILHPLINFKGLYKGRYSLKISGIPSKKMKGHVIIEGGVMKGFEVYNNTLALINTLPALAVLQKPGYSKEGFSIEEGVVEYRRIGKHKIIFDSIYIKGAAATIVGKGKLNLKTRTIHMNLAILVAREFGKVVGSLPILGYILMGEDKSVTIGLKITGSLDNPKVTTSGTKEMLLLPLDILKRTLESPTYMLKGTSNK